MNLFCFPLDSNMFSNPSTVNWTCNCPGQSGFGGNSYRSLVQDRIYRGVVWSQHIHTSHIPDGCMCINKYTVPVIEKAADYIDIEITSCM